MKQTTALLKRTALAFFFLALTGITFSQSLPDNAIKKNIHPINSPLKSILQLEPAVFEYDTHNFKHLNLRGGKHYGFMAENMQTVFPGLVREKHVSYMFGKNVYRDAKIKTIDEASLIPILVAAFKEQQAEIDKLKLELQELKNRSGTLAQ